MPNVLTNNVLKNCDYPEMGISFTRYHHFWILPHNGRSMVKKRRPAKTSLCKWDQAQIEKM